MSGSELYLVRHAQAAASDDGDPGLTEVGTAQAVALGARLAGRPIARILHSPRRRAVQTAALLADALPGVPLTASTLLDDRTPVPSPARCDEYPAELWDRLADTPSDEQDVDGATLTSALAELGAMTGSGTVVAVTHAFVIGWFVRCVLSAPTAAWTGLAPDNAGLTIVDFSRGARLVAYNA